MDLSKLSDAQRQELEQLQKQFQEYQAQQQKQQEASAAAASAAATTVQQQPPAYDPSQYHLSYDPSQYHQSYDPSQAYQQQLQYAQRETLVATTVPSEQQRNAGPGSGSLGSGQVQVQDPYVHPGNQVGHPPPAYRGGGRRGGGPFRGGGGGGGGRGNFGFRPPMSGPLFHGRGPLWCELCRVDCTSKEILETQKNGKRHQKNLQKLQETNQPVPVSVPVSGRGGKRQRATGPPKPKVVIPLMCDLCNVNCDTQEVFDRHVGGKKHIAKLKRFQGHQVMYGPTAVQALHPPPKVVIPLMCDLCNVNCDTQGVLDRHVGGKKHIAKLKMFQGHQAMYGIGPTAVQALYPLSQSQTLGGPTPNQPPYVGAAPPAPPPPSEVVYPNPQLADAPLQFGTQNATAAVSQPQPWSWS